MTKITVIRKDTNKIREATILKQDLISQAKKKAMTSKRPKKLK